MPTINDLSSEERRQLSTLWPEGYPPSEGDTPEGLRTACSLICQRYERDAPEGPFNR